jgi:hypothetical protein
MTQILVNFWLKRDVAATYLIPRSGYDVRVVMCLPYYEQLPRCNVCWGPFTMAEYYALSQGCERCYNPAWPR